MPCYSYLNGYPISFNNNIEVVIATGGSYSYSTIAWVCEFPVNDQLKVYKRATIGGTDILLIETTHYTINTTTSTITFGNGVLTGMEQVVIRRKTPDTRMITRFVDGAKLKAKDLNSCFHQLLFLNQEKEFLPATINHYHSIPSAMPAWTTPFTYTVGSIVQNAGLIYRCILATTGNQITTNTTYWTQVAPSQNGFVLIGGPSPVAFDFTNLSIGHAIIWDGAKFISNPFTGALASLTDVSTSGAVTGDVLIYNGTTSTWTKATPSFNMVLNALILKNHVFYLNTTTTSYNTGSTLDVSTKSFLSGFKNVSNQWVLTDAPTVYHIIQKTITAAGTTDPQTFFTDISSQLTGLAANVSNPIKVKLTWMLSTGLLNLTDTVSGESLLSPQGSFWDSPEELYSVTGYNNSSSLKFHGISDGTHKYKSSPYYFRKANVGDSVQVGYVSKLSGYGVKAFYLSVPECRTSIFHGVPITQGNLYYNLTNIGSVSAFITNVNLPGNEQAHTWSDYYLLNLRDMAFASNRETVTTFPTTQTAEGTRDRDYYARLYKGLLICVDYDGLVDVSFKRHEESGGSLNAFWKIPKNIIYFNKAALALSYTTAAQLDTSMANFASSLQRTVRFTGYSSVQQLNDNNFSDVAAIGDGIYFKADRVWTEWCSAWVASPTTKDYRFNESDIDWVCSGFTPASATTNLKLYTTTYNYIPQTFKGDSGLGTLSNSNDASEQFPWQYRPNNIQIPVEGSNITGYIGTHLLNIDSNTIFSNAHNFAPDPTDEYVYRLVVDPSKLSYFADLGYSKIKSSIILEYGFQDANISGSTTTVTTLGDVFQNSILEKKSLKANSRLDKSNVFVYIKREMLEVTDGITRYIVTLGIRVPRVKSIGYSKVFRSFDGTGVTFPQQGTTASDTFIDSGPWNFGGFSTLLTPQREVTPVAQASGNFIWNAFGGSDASSIFYTNPFGSGEPSATPTIWDTAYNPGRNEIISGRNECAVKFTRVGIPNTLWIRISILNSDGEVDLLNSTTTTGYASPPA